MVTQSGLTVDTRENTLTNKMLTQIGVTGWLLSDPQLNYFHKVHFWYECLYALILIAYMEHVNFKTA